MRPERCASVVAEVLNMVRTMPGRMSLLRSVELVVVETSQRSYRVSRAREDDRFAAASRRNGTRVYAVWRSDDLLDLRQHREPLDAFSDRAIAQVEQQSASEGVLVARTTVALGVATPCCVSGLSVRQAAAKPATDRCDRSPRAADRDVRGALFRSVSSR
jgi:hypothetical protein